MSHPRSAQLVLVAMLSTVAVACAGDRPPDCADAGVESEVRACGGECVDLRSDPEHCGACGTACGEALECRGGGCCLPAILAPALDLLFVVDDSPAMREERAAFAAELPRLLQALGTGDRDGDGAPDFDPPESIQLGVVTADMGSGAYPAPSCDPPDFGDDGVLRSTTDGRTAGCLARYPSFLSFAPRGASTSDDVATDLACLVENGDGCVFGQPLEAGLKALTPSTSDVTFFRGTTGHGDVESSGFLRPRASIGIVVLSNRDDCSAADPALFDIDSSTYEGVRCGPYPDALHPLSRYADGFAALHRGDPARLAFAVVAGVPTDLTVPGTSYDDMLADARMQPRVDSAGTALEPSCDGGARGSATPPSRLVGLAKALDTLGASTRVASICAPELGGATESILDAIEPVLLGFPTCIGAL